MQVQSDGRYPALKYQDFKYSLFGQFISNIGNQMQIVALNWHIYLLTHSAVALGLIGLSRFLPIAVFSLLGGSFADVHNRKTIRIISQVLLALLSGVLVVTTFTHNASPTIIYVVTILSAIVISFDLPAMQAFVPNLVDRKHLPSAMSLNFIMFQTSIIIGPAIGGLLIGAGGVAPVYLFNTVSFLAVIVSLFLMKTSGEPKTLDTSEKSTVSIKAIVEGLRFVKSRTLIWSTMILDFFSTLFASATVILPIFARDILKVGPEGLGLLYAAPSIGAVTAGLIFANAGKIKNQGKLLLVAVGVYGLATIAFGLSKNFILSLFLLAIVGAGDSVSTIIRNIIRSLETPDNIRGRMTAINMIFFMGGPQLGEFEAGILAAAVGGPISVVIGGVGTLIAASFMTILVPALRRYHGHEA